MELERYKKIEKIIKNWNKFDRFLTEKIFPPIVVIPSLSTIAAIAIFKWTPNPAAWILVYALGPAVIFALVLILNLLMLGSLELAMFFVSIRDEKIAAYKANLKLEKEKENLEEKARNIVIDYETTLSKIGIRIDEIKEEIKKNEEEMKKC